MLDMLAIVDGDIDHPVASALHGTKLDLICLCGLLLMHIAMDVGTTSKPSLLSLWKAKPFLGVFPPSATVGRASELAIGRPNPSRSCRIAYRPYLAIDSASKLRRSYERSTRDWKALLRAESRLPNPTEWQMRRRSLSKVFCLFTEAIYCFANSVVSTHFLLQDEFNIQTTTCDRAWRGDMEKIPKQAIMENGLLKDADWRKDHGFVNVEKQTTLFSERCSPRIPETVISESAVLHVILELESMARWPCYKIFHQVLHKLRGHQGGRRSLRGPKLRL
eukprot:Gb_17155 [translate_table: standard]